MPSLWLLLVELVKCVMSLVSVETVAADPRREASQSSALSPEDLGTRMELIKSPSDRRKDICLSVSLSEVSSEVFGSGLIALVSAGEDGGDDGAEGTIVVVSSRGLFRSPPLSVVGSEQGAGETDLGGLVEKETRLEMVLVVAGEMSASGWSSPAEGSRGGARGEVEEQALKRCGERARAAKTSSSSAARGALVLEEWVREGDESEEPSR